MAFEKVFVFNLDRNRPGIKKSCCLGKWSAQTLYKAFKRRVRLSTLQTEKTILACGKEHGSIFWKGVVELPQLEKLLRTMTAAF